jgi:hypothetical protein
MSNVDGLTKTNINMTFHCSCKLVALELHNSCLYIVVHELHELHRYMVSHTMNINYICCNSCDLFDSTHAHRNMLNCNELQMFIVSYNSKTQLQGQL